MAVLNLMDRMRMEAGFPPLKRQNKDGGPGSGNFGHSGVPGQVGGSAPGNGSRAVVNGSDISRSYNGKPDIKSVMEAQGFTGLPKVVSKEEFDKAVKASSFIAQRTYSASSQEILDAYRNQLYNGEWYVECEVGGCQYGQGMYCAADYNGELTDGIKAEMEHYRETGESREGMKSHRQEISDMKTAEAKREYDTAIQDGTKDFSDDEKLIFKSTKLYEGTSEEDDKAYELMGKMTREERKAFNQKSNSILADAETRRNLIAWMSVEEYAEKHGLEIDAKPASYTETLTLDPSAKVVTFDEISKSYKEYRDSLPSYESSKATARNEIFTEMGLTPRQKADYTTMFNLYESATTQRQMDKLAQLQSKYPDVKLMDLSNKLYKRVSELREEQFRDVGAYAAACGYDAINAEGHGESGSYTVILNRTKTIILDGNGRQDAKDDSVIFFQLGSDGVIYAIRAGKVIGWVSAGMSDGKKSDSSEKPLDFKAQSATIKSKEDTAFDGAPKGNQNAAGPHKGGGGNGHKLSQTERTKLENRFVGKKSSKGTEIKKFSEHAFERLGGRAISAGRFEKMLNSTDTKPDKNHPDRTLYDVPGSRMVLADDGTVISIMWRRQN